jgi:predicted RNA-binding Zn-ribbon protein involved in translation (DUF1610 family)
MLAKNIFMKNPIFQTCPQCGEVNTLRISHPRNWRESFIDNLTFYKIYRCRKCGWRDYLSTFNRSALTVKIILSYSALVILIAFIVMMILSKLVK